MSSISIRVAVPPHTSAGYPVTEVTVKIPDGRHVKVSVPAGLAPGQTFTVRVPALEPTLVSVAPPGSASPPPVARSASPLPPTLPPRSPPPVAQVLATEPAPPKAAPDAPVAYAEPIEAPAPAPRASPSPATSQESISRLQSENEELRRQIEAKRRQEELQRENEALRRQLAAASLGPPAPAPAPAVTPTHASRDTISIVCPANAPPGSVVTVAIPDGRRVRATVPPGAVAGSRFSVHVPGLHRPPGPVPQPKLAAGPTASSSSGSGRTGSSASSGGSSMSRLMKKKWGSLSGDERKFVMDGTLLLGETLLLGGDGALLSAFS